ncbi:hypothetical protein ANANG_G00002840 [Anguilla anguilla]|uniref:BRCT domain-containing protein n=1 Tax=Anguilla anguilla TaxID=7936 RepID=A0A9D3MWH5_ANGAN|nr:hypothetical protein ANANG_G00002840 [Anguilla anguilla]
MGEKRQIRTAVAALGRAFVGLFLHQGGEREPAEERAGGRGRGGGQRDPYAGSTDENTDAEAEEDKPIPDLPDFLTGKRFFLYGKFPPSERRLLLRYIVAFNGSVEDYMSEKVQFVITSEGGTTPLRM